MNIIDLRSYLPTHAKRRFPKRNIGQVDTIVIHHTASASNQTVKSIAQYHSGPTSHVCKGGCPGICYHYVINRLGKIYLCNDLESLVYHAAPMNTKSIGICLIGNFDKIEPNQVQLDALDYLIPYLRNNLLKKELQVIGHRDACNGCKSCPGQNMYAVVEKYQTSAGKLS